MSERFKNVSSLRLQVAPQIEEVIFVCMWQGAIMPNCTSLDSSFFSPVMSDEGLCYTFNMLSNTELFTPTA